MLNPGKIVATPRAEVARMDDRELFRYGPEYRATSLPTVASSGPPPPASGGHFARNVEACNNNGACRKLHDGVMCPSYRVTREEADTTRGRANVLRLAMTGQLGPRGLEGDEVAEVLELCVGCKACKRECPAGVDMARLKAEVLHLANGRRGMPLRERLFASLPRTAPTASRLPRLLNLRNRSRALAWLGERALGIAAERKLPEWHLQPFRDRELVAPDAASGTDGAVVLLVDTFTRYFEPEIPRAAARLLRRLGCEPVSPAPPGAPARRSRRPLCCGRTYISAGMLDHARAEIERTLAALSPLARRGLPIVGLEPSCLLTLRDEALHLCPGDEAAAVAERAVLVDEFLAERASPGDREAPGDEPGDQPAGRHPRVSIHGHCHQKAAGTADATARALSAAAGVQGALVDSTCCGMAGSFGYAAKHLRTSRSMGELDLFPTLRAAPPDQTVIANGFSCRAQIPGRNWAPGAPPRRSAAFVAG